VRFGHPGEDSRCLLAHVIEVTTQAIGVPLLRKIEERRLDGGWRRILGNTQDLVVRLSSD